MNDKRSWFYKLSLAAVVFGLVAIPSVWIVGKPATGGRMGLVDDWTTRHVIFSNPGTAAEALAQGRFEKWYKIVNDPRYIMQQAKRNHVSSGSTAITQGLATLFNRLTMPFTATVLAASKAPPKKAPAAKRDWAVSLGTGTVAQNMSPAKFTFNVNATPSCTNDFAVYGLNVAETAKTASTQSNMIALNNLYSGSGTPFCSGHTTPTVDWAYNVTTVTGEKVTTSPVLSLDGSKVIFVESGGSSLYLHVLAWKAGEGSIASSAVPANYETNVGSCPTTGSPSCLVSILLNSTTETVTNGSPYYDYNSDTVYTGDDAGNLYKVHPVLGSGTPAVTTLNLGLTVGADTSVMTGPTYDPSSGFVFVGASNGEVYAVTASSFSAVAGSFQLGDSSCGGGYNRRLTDAPIVDSSNGWVYEFVTADTNDNTVVVEASTAGPFTTQNVVTVGQGDSGCNSSTFFPTHEITFDNNYYIGTTGASGTIEYGHIWVCGRNTGNSAASLWEIPTSTKVSSSYTGSISGVTGVQNTAQIQNSDTHEQCSPFTEIYNGTTDYLFFGEGLSGSFGSLYGFTLADSSSTTEAASLFSSGDPYTVPTATGGTSAIVIDNVSADAQASSIYFTTLATSTTVCGGTAAYCAIKLTQSALQ